VQSAGRIKKRIDFIGELLPDFRAIGMRVGIDVLCTLGHHEEHIDRTIDEFDFYEDENGIKNLGRLCSSSKKTKEYVQEIYSYAASVHPDTIHIDDDLHYVVDCRCKRCEEIFNKKYSSDENKRRIFTEERLCDIFKIIENAVHSVDSKIIIGWMTCRFGGDETDYSTYAEAIRGSANEIIWRPGGGVYSDNGLTQLIKKAHSIGRQVAALPSFVKERYSEIENFPYFPLDKSTDYMKCEVLTYISAGCNSTAFNVFSMYSGNFDEYVPVLEETDSITAIADTYVKLLGDKKIRGIGKIFSKDISADAAEYGDDIYSIGLPPAYSDEESLFYIITGKSVKSIDRKTLLCALKRGVMLDGEALEYINSLGLSEYTGFSSSPTESGEFLIEKSLKHDLNATENELRDVHTSFGWIGDMPKVYRIQKNAENAEYLTSLINYDNENCGFASGIFENSLGGRIYVSGYVPFNWNGSKGRTIGLKRICKYLSRDRIPAYVASFHKIALWSRDDCISLLNLASGTSRKVKIAVLTDKSTLALYRQINGTVKEERATLVNVEGKYKIFEINDLSYQETLLCKIQ
jgi:hypothetical protein